MQALFYAVILGAFVGWVLKLTSPGRTTGAWLLSLLVGAIGAVGGAYLARILGYERRDDIDDIAFYCCAALAAAGLVMVYALISRTWWWRVRPSEKTPRPSFVF